MWIVQQKKHLKLGWYQFPTGVMDVIIHPDPKVSLK